MSIVRDGEPSATSEIGPEVTALIYELLDAHADTVELAGLLQADTRWRVHLDYLTDLQRTGREMLARKHHEVQD